MKKFFHTEFEALQCESSMASATRFSSHHNDSSIAQVSVEFLEKISEKRLLLSWREAGRCNYTEQLWSLQKASHLRTCAISGKEIHEGDQIFCPVGKPLNHDQCILSDMVGIIMAPSLAQVDGC